MDLDYFATLGKLFDSTPVSDLAMYIRFKVLDSMQSVVPSLLSSGTQQSLKQVLSLFLSIPPFLPLPLSFVDRTSLFLSVCVCVCVCVCVLDSTSVSDLAMYIRFKVLDSMQPVVPSLLSSGTQQSLKQVL